MKQIWVCAVLIGMGGISFAEIPPQSGMDPESGSGSSIDRPDFKVRNQPAAPARVSGSPDMAEGVGVEFESLPRTTQFEPAPEEILSAVPVALALRYIDGSDFDKRMTVLQVAAKYLGASSMGADSLVVRWMMMSDSEQKSAKLAWFEAAKANIPLEEFNRYVDLRAYRVLTALRKTQTPGIRPVEAPRKIKTFEVEKLQMPGIRPVGEPEDAADATTSGELLIPPPPLKPYVPSEDEGLPAYEPEKIFEETPVKEPAGESEEEPQTERLPTYFGIPSGLRNTP